MPCSLQFFLMTWVGNHVLRNLREEVFRHIHRLSLGYYAKNEAGDIMSRITNDMDTLQQAMNFALLQVLSGVLLIVWIIYNPSVHRAQTSRTSRHVTPGVSTALTTSTSRSSSSLSILCWRIGIAVAGILLLEGLHAPSFHFGEWPEIGL